jgi:hypothetical protein
MKHAPLVLALVVLLGVALGFYAAELRRPDDSLFGREVALAAELPELVLPRGPHALSGRVRTHGGAPAEEALIALSFPEGSPRADEPPRHATTDAEGHFRIHGLEPGTYRALLVHPLAPPRTFPLEVPAAAELELELAEPLPPLPTLPELVRTRASGRIHMPAGLQQPTADALLGFEVVLRPVAETPLLAGAAERRASTAADGSFAFEGLVVARYALEVLPPWARGGSWPILARGTLNAGDGTPFELELEVGAVAGELSEADGEPLVGALVELTALDARDVLGAPQLWTPCVSDAAGAFRIELLPPGRYRVHVRAGAAAQDVEVVLERGRLARVPPLTLDPRGAPAAGG